MTRYRDKKTGEVVEAKQFGKVVHIHRIMPPWYFDAEDFRARFEPVEDVTAQPSVKE